MSARDRVNAFLTAQRPSQFCDDCIAESLEFNGKPNVQEAISALMTTHRVHRALGVCSMCGEEKAVIQRAKGTKRREAPDSDK